MELIKMHGVAKKEAGALMIEVVVTIAIIAIGVAGLMQMQTRLQQSEVEAYQRTQALILLNDMADRLSINRANAAQYITSSFLGVGGESSVCDSTGTTLHETDQREWCNSLKGAAETFGSDNDRVGAMIGGRGCVESLSSDNDVFRVTVAWQGLTPIEDPNDISCAKSQYNFPSGSNCVNNKCRRYITTLVRFANLEAP